MTQHDRPTDVRRLATWLVLLSDDLVASNAARSRPAAFARLLGVALQVGVPEALKLAQELHKARRQGVGR